MTTKKQTQPKQKYQFLVTRHQTYQFEIEAKTAEDACKLLQRKLQVDTQEKDVPDSQLVFSSWNDPAEPREEWAVMRTTPAEHCDFLLVQAWNGKRFSAVGEAEIGDSIETALRKILNPRTVAKKPKKKSAS